MTKEKKVVITTKHRGVFFGTVDGHVDVNEAVTLRDVRMAVYWSPDVKGLPGLAASGPTAGCRISPAAPSMTIPKGDATAALDCSDQASAAWESEPWS